MKANLDKRQLYLFSAGILILAVLFAVLYTVLLEPAKNETKMAENELDSQMKLLEAMSASANTAENQTFDSTVTLQKQLPVKPLTDQLLLSLEKAEITSGSFITALSVTEGEAMADPAAAEASSDTEGQEGAAAEEGGTEETAAGEAETLPAGIEKVSVAMTVQAPSYFELESFLETVHAMNRIVKVDNLTFTGVEEISSIEQTVEPLTIQLTVSAFYAPLLTDLISQLPEMQVPARENKRDPMAGQPSPDAGTAGEEAEDADEE